MTESATSPEFLTVKELAALLRVTERKVYDLAASGQVPCSKATGKLLFPDREVRQWIADAQTGPEHTPSRGLARPPVFLGSHDPLLDWALRHSGSGLASMFDASLDGLRRFQSGEGIAAGLHMPEGDEAWNVATVAEAAKGENAALIHWATRARGFVARPEHAKALNSIRQLTKLRMARRQSDAGSEALLLRMLASEDIDPENVRFVGPFRSEQEAMLAVLQGDADITLGLEALAVPFGLSFAKVVDESYDILIDRKAWFDRPMQALFGFAQTATFKDHVDRMPGVNVEMLGKILWNA